MNRETLVSVAVLSLGAILASADAHASADDARPAARGAAGRLDGGTNAATSGPPATPANATEDAAQGGSTGDPHGGGGGDPHGGGASGDGMPEVPEDGAMEAPSTPKGSIEVLIADPMGQPIRQTEVTLGILYNSVAKGESRKRISRTTDEGGIARFVDLDTGSGVAYRPMVLKDGATFSVSPFALGPKNGMRALLHVYPVTGDVDQSLIVTQAMVYAEVKDDRIQIQQAFKVYNFGQNAWVPHDVLVPLPETFTAFATQQGMTDIGIDAVPNKGAKLRGTFGPGQHVVEFRWQLPYTGDAQVNFAVGMPPHLAAARVITPASKGMGMEVDGFDPPKASTDGMGQRALTTEKQLRRDDPPVKAVMVSIKGLPTEGPGKVIATLLALGGIAVGLVFGSRKPPPRDTKREREQLLEALEALERGHRDGSIGPKTYERSRRELLDEVARTFARDPKGRSPKPGRTARKPAS